MIVLEEDPSVPKLDMLVICWGAYEGACGALSSWSEDYDIVYTHHRCFEGAYVAFVA